MYLEAIGESLPMAVGAALSPIPVAAAVSILLSARPANAPAFLLGWAAGICSVALIVFVLPGFETERGGPTILVGWLRIVLGGSLLVLATRKWQARPAEGTEIKPPKVLAGLDAYGLGKSVLLGIAMSALNPKNLALTVAAATAIDTSGLGAAGQGIALAIYTSVASLSIVAPIVA
ncbi:MAG: GAP family protein, partial [Verrucomicrobiales bacterium]